MNLLALPVLFLAAQTAQTATPAPTTTETATSPAPAATAPPPAPTAEEQAQAERSLAFADHLFLDGDWYRSITEYRRYLYEMKGRGAEAPRAALAIGEALARGEQWDAAGRQLDGVAERAPTLAVRHDALFGAGRVYLLDGRPELAKPRFRLLVEEDGTAPQLKSEATWLLAWGHFDAGEFAEARVYLQRLADEKGAHAQEASGFLAALDAREHLALKNPLLAGVLSLIPGLGHFYLGQWAIGATSLVWNAMFIAAAVFTFIQGDWAIGALLTVFELGWYSGGVFGAVAGAYRHNRDVVQNWRDDTLARYGMSREMPDMKASEGKLPGTAVRFTGAF